MADSSENILVEFDYNNIAIVDPNKVVDEFGRAKERLVKHENLVMYANLQCKVLPRSKLLIGASNADNLRTISTTEINFLNPGNATYLNTKWTDEITGKDTITGEGVNQRKIGKFEVTKPDKSKEYFYSQSTSSNKEPKAVDNGMLGMKSIQIKYGLDFLPQVNIKLEDVKGRTLFESGNDSPYAAFFNLPYPLFYLTIKGFYGKALQLPLMLQDFNCTFNAQTNNFDIDLVLITYKYSILSEVNYGAVLATPHMYTNTVQVTNQTQSNSQKTNSRTSEVEYGYQKVKEVFSEYKAKGLIDKEFPELTLYQLKYNLDNFIKNVLESFIKQNLDPITHIQNFLDDIKEFEQKVVFFTNNPKSWVNKYLDKKNYFITTQDKVKLYPPNNEGTLNFTTAKNELVALIKEYNAKLRSNKTLGKNGKYEVNGLVVNCEVPTTISEDDSLPDFIVNGAELNSDEDIDYTETFKSVSGNTEPTQSQLAEMRNTYNIFEARRQAFFRIEGVFRGKKSFLDKTKEMIKNAEAKREEITTALTKALSDILKSKKNDLGFVPTIRNVMAVLFASSEAYLRLLDEVHQKAWEKSDSLIRKAAIFSVNTQGANPDDVRNIQDRNVRIPIYPWPEFLIETSGEEGQERFQPRYPADPDVINQTRADVWEEWPEVEFVEEFVKGLTKRLTAPNQLPEDNEIYDVKRLSLNALEYPANNEIYSNQEETKYFYEIYERLIIDSFYSKLNRSVGNNTELGKLIKAAAEVEKINIVESLRNGSPFLINKLVNSNLTSTNYLSYLRSFSNSGVGESWQNFIRGIFNTSYLKNYVEKNQSGFFYDGFDPQVVNGQNVNTTNLNNLVSFSSEEDISSYISGSSTTKKFDFTDTYPFTNETWCKTNLPGLNNTSPASLNFANVSNNTPVNEFYDSTKNLYFNSILKTVTNFDNNNVAAKPFCNYNFVSLKYNINDIQNSIPAESNLFNLDNFYKARSANYRVQFPTEGNLNYSQRPGILTQNQTVSIFNTPYFINSIQEGVFKFRSFNEYPYTVPAYLFLNSLPLSTLREKYSVFSETTPANSTQPIESVKFLNFIIPTLKKFGAIHNLPYAWVLKIGSIWHRYKVWVETGNDILTPSWQPFNYIDNFDPITSSTTKNYALTLSGGQNVDIVLEKETVIGNQKFTQINTGFYPKLIDDFNIFLQGYKLFTGYTSSEVQQGIQFGLNIVNSPDSNITMNFSGDPSNPNRYIQMNSWSVYVNSLDNRYSYILPSHGALLNQAYSECFEDGKKKIELSGNTSIYNGSVRTFWNAPNYGYFDPTKIVKPNPDEYMKKVFAGYVQQENFSLNSSTAKYTNFSELFTTFEKNILDEFEKKFLDFSKDKYSYVEKNESATFQQTIYSNFHLFYGYIMQLDYPTSTDQADIISELQEKQFDKISKSISGFLNYNINFKLGNPSNFDRFIFANFSTQIVPDRILIEGYRETTNNALPNGTNGQTVVGSKISYPDEWKTLLEYVGFSDVPGISYSDTGCTIFDFFIDLNIAFNLENIKNFSPLIKIYATQKNKNSNYNRTQFSLDIDKYFLDGTTFINKTLDNLFPQLTKELSSVKIEKTQVIEPVTTGQQSKLELWETFKATNDKWIAGMDFKNKTLFEDILFLDRASRDVGQKVICDIYKLASSIDPDKVTATTNVLDLAETLVKEAKFYTMYMPSYINFYGVPEPVANATPKPEGSLELANTLFGTFTSVDYRESSAKMVNFYGGKPSTQLDKQGIIDGFKNDSFDLRRVTDNPLIENQTDKKDWATSNKVIGFNVDVGPQNQGIFRTFSVSQKNSTPTAESLEILSQIASQAGNRGFATQNLSLYNLYKIRSYTCDVTMMGNALIQPMMYFNLRYVPMFSGPYMITSVDHTIDATNFTTRFGGIRQPIANLNIEVDFLQSLRTNLVEQVVNEKIQELQNQKKAGETNILNQTANIAKKNIGQTYTTTNSCTANTRYSSYTQILVPAELKLDVTSVVNKIETTLTEQNYTGVVFDKLKYAIFAKIYLENNAVVTNGVKGFQRNYGGIDLNQNWGDSSKFLSKDKKYFCVSKKGLTIPYAVFDTDEDFINFMISRYATLQARVTNDITSPKFYEDLAILVTTNFFDESAFNGLNATNKQTLIDRVKESIVFYNKRY